MSKPMKSRMYSNHNDSQHHVQPKGFSILSVNESGNRFLKFEKKIVELSLSSLMTSDFIFSVKEENVSSVHARNQL